MDNIKKKSGRPLNSVSTIPFNLGQLYQKFGPNACPDIGVKWLKKHGLFSEQPLSLDNSLPIPQAITTEIKPSVKIVDFDNE